MFSFVTDLVVGIFDFILDVFMFRRMREHRGRRERHVVEDAQAMASFDLITVTYITLTSVGVMLLLKLVLGLSTGLSIGIGIVVGVIWAVWRYMKMVNEP